MCRRRCSELDFFRCRGRGCPRGRPGGGRTGSRCGMAATDVGHGVFDGTEMDQRGRGRRWGRCPVPFGVGLHSYGRTSSFRRGDKCFSRPTAHEQPTRNTSVHTAPALIDSTRCMKRAQISSAHCRCRGRDACKVLQGQDAEKAWNGLLADSFLGRPWAHVWPSPHRTRPALTGAPGLRAPTSASTRLSEHARCRRVMYMMLILLR